MKRTFTGSRFSRFFFITTAIFILHVQSYAGTWIITSANDSGAGTLRAALDPSTGASSGDLIIFSSGMTINLSSSILITKTNITIDATNISGWSAGSNLVTISGGGTTDIALKTSTAYSSTNLVIKGLIFSGFITSCLSLQDASNFTIKNCWFGFLANGSTVAANTGYCISITKTSSSGNIGTGNPLERNIFMTTNSSAGACINLNGVGSGGGINIKGNYFGTNYAGTAVTSPTLNVNSAIKTSGTSAGDIVIGGTGANDGNLIEGCATSSAVWLSSSSNFNISILGNKIGTISPNYNGILLGTNSNSSITISNNNIKNSTHYAVDASPSTYNDVVVITKNSFSNNTTGGINDAITGPTISYATTAKVGGTGATANATIDIYTWDGLKVAQGSAYVATVTADASGNWFYYGTFTVGQKVVVTATPVVSSPTNPTTKFSAAFTVTTCPTTVNAGSDQTICATNSTVSLSGSSGGSGASSPQWSVITGAGTLSNANVYNPIYTPNATELNATGTITLTLQLTVNTATCAATINDQVSINITPKPVVNAGTTQTLCANSSVGAALNGTVTVATGGTWTGGSGTYSPNASTLNASYTPTAAELSAGSNIVLTLTSTGNGSCTAITSQKTLSITAAPTVNAGADKTVCANAFPVSITATKTVATGVSWNGGAGSFAPNSTSTTFTYQPTTAEIAAGTVTLTVTTTGNGTCNSVTDNIMITITPAPVVNAGADQTYCVPVAGTITLTGSVTGASGIAWSTTGAGASFPASATSITYNPTAAENSTTSSINIVFTLTSTGNGSCNAVSDQLLLTLTPSPTANAGSDLSMCSNSTNISLSGNVAGASTSIWTSSGSGTFANASLASGAVYSPSSADRTAGLVTLTLTASGGGCGSVSDALVLTINSCLADPELSFESPNVYKSNGDAPFKHRFTPLKSTGAITYTIATPTSCATISADGYVTLTCVDNPITVKAFQAASQFYRGDTASYTLYIGKAVTNITLESRGSDLAGGPFQLKATTNYDQPLTYAIVSGDVNAVTITSGGVITPVGLGTVIIRARASGDANFEAATSNDASVTIYPTLTKPVAVNDTLHLLIAEQKTIRLADNDYGTTASINLSPMLIDIDSENPGLQTKYFKPGIGIFTIDTTGLLTFSAFEAFIGIDSIQYTITDANGLVSNKASLVLQVTSPVAEIALKANEIITANGDNLNNALVIGYTDLSQGNDLLIVDAAGNKLFYAKNYQNNWTATDDSGRDLGNGVYYFIFREFDHIGTVRRQLKGNFTVIR